MEAITYESDYPQIIEDLTGQLEKSRLLIKDLNDVRLAQAETHQYLVDLMHKQMRELDRAIKYVRRS